MMAVRNQCRHGVSARVIESIYDAGVDPTLWPVALEAVRGYIWADSVLLRVCADAFGDVLQVTSVGFDSSYVRAYRDEHVRDDPILPILDALPAGRMILFEGAPALCESHDGRGGLQQANEPHVMGGPLLRRDGIDVMIGLQRGHDAPVFGARELTRLKRIAPHLARALSLADRLERISVRAKLADTMLGTALTGIILFDAVGRVTYLNPIAQSLLGGQVALTLRNQRLKTPYPKLQRWLDLVTTSARREAEGEYRDGSSARFTAYDGTGDLALMVLPWRKAEFMPTWPATEVVTIGLLTPLDCRETYSVERIQTLFGLTRGEASLTAALVTSGSLSAAAQCLRIRSSTARDRLKSIFRKTGFTTQMALACAVIRSSTREVPPIVSFSAAASDTI